jgi:RHS repeat-associated protein
MNSTSGTDVDRYKYGFDKAGNRTWREHTNAPNTSNPNGGWDEAYMYDGLYQLTYLGRGDLNTGHTAIAGTPKWQEDFSFDPTGNLMVYQTHVGSTETLDQHRTHNKANEIATIEGSSATVAYDAVGNMTKMPKVGNWSTAQTLQWDPWNRLVRITEGEETIAEYAYDGLNRRILKDVLITEEPLRHYYYSDQWQVLEERTGTGGLADCQFLWGMRYIDDLILRDRHDVAPYSSSEASESSESSSIANSDSSSSSSSSEENPPERLYALHDQWHVVALIARGGSLAERYAYTAFGSRIVLSQSFSPRIDSIYEWDILYGAYRLDSETGLYQIRYRFLHPGSGRWLSRDPVQTLGEFNLYRYSQNSPVNLTDPLGLWVVAERIASPTEIIEGLEAMEAYLESLSCLTPFGPALTAKLVQSETLFAGYMLWNPGGNTDGGNRFIFTCKYGWIDVGHFLGSAYAAYLIGVKHSLMIGLMVEDVQSMSKTLASKLPGKKYPWGDSANTPEDINSDLQGAKFGASLGPDDSIAEKLNQWFKDAGAVAVNSETQPFLNKDVREGYGRTVTIAEAKDYRKSHTAWKCLCDGDQPKKGFAW